MRKKIINYLVNSLLGSMVLYWVNGTPAKRYYRVKELAKYMYNRMPQKQKEEIFDKIKKYTKPPL